MNMLENQYQLPNDSLIELKAEQEARIAQLKTQIAELDVKKAKSVTKLKYINEALNL